MASRSEDLLKKQLEDFAGREIGLEADQLKWLEYPVGASHYTVDGYVASRMLGAKALPQGHIIRCRRRVLHGSRWKTDPAAQRLRLLSRLVPPRFS